MSIKVAGGKKENGIVIGNSYDKYGAKNPIVKWMMNGFESSLSSFVEQVNPKEIHEVGCGEGYWILNWSKNGMNARGCDFSTQIIDIAQQNARSSGISPTIFKSRSIYDLIEGEDSADLMVCCEVLEHLEDPEAGLRALQRVATDYVILSVPREPIWCVLNLARGKYISSLGNTPGHLQNWSKNKFLKLVSQYFTIVDVKTPLPWTMVLCRRF